MSFSASCKTGGAVIVTEKQEKSANFLRIVNVLQKLREQKKITEKEYHRAKKYYQKLTGADITIVS